MTKLSAKPPLFPMSACVIFGLVLSVAIVRMDAAPRGRSAAMRAEANRVSVDGDDIGGVVTSPKGPEAGVWVIAETAELQTKFRKIVVTNDQGQYLLPDLPKAKYKVWVRGYGLVDSEPVEAMPGRTLALTAVIAPTPRAAAEYYPASYWIALLKVPPKSAFPMHLAPPPPLPGAGGSKRTTHGPGSIASEPPTTVIANQTEWLFNFKGGCWGCHQVGNKSTREIPASLGKFNSTSDAWLRFISSGQMGRSMISAMDRIGHKEGLALYSDWIDRIAKGELPAVPPRPQGTERNEVVTLWDWAGRAAFLHALISSDKRDPTVNANGPIYGANWTAGALAVVDPVENTESMIHIPLPNENDRKLMPSGEPLNQIAPSVYFGDELIWNDPVSPGPITMDGKGRVWFNVETRIGNADYCKAGSSNPYAQNSPREDGGKGVDVYDPKTHKFGFVDLCFRATRIVFSDDQDQTLYFAVQGDGGIGWLNTRLWDQTHDAEKSQGWCPAVIDVNGDGKIGTYTQAPEPIDPDLDRAVPQPGVYGVAYNPADGSVWTSALRPDPGRLIRITRGANPPSTCLAEVYEPPAFQGPGMGGSHTRGIDVDTNGVVWTPLTGEGNLASFDRRKCKVLTGAAATTGRHCPEGWTFYPMPGPAFKTEPTIKSDYYYYMWVDRYNSLGLGNNVPIIDGADSDSMLAFQPQTKTWVRLYVPYPMGFFSRFFDGRIDDPKAGWKGRGLWAANQTKGTQLTEGGKSMPSQLAHFQIRPDPLAK
jgi:hypothetical protein